jgi:macrolide-specific efflux system membrane fusion protein
MRRNGRILAINGVLVLTLGAAGWGAYQLLWPSNDSSAASNARHVAVARASVVESVSAAGTLQSGYTASANFAASGTVTEIDVKVGDLVAVGQQLAKVDATQANQQVKAAQSSLDAAEEDLANAKTAAATTTTPPPGGQSGSSAPSITSLQAKVDQAALTLQQAKDALSSTVLTAPGAGTVTAISGSVGQKVSSSSGASAASGSTSTATSSGFITLTDLANLVVKANVAEIDVSKVKAGQDATVTINALPDTPVAAKVISADLTPTATNNIVQFGVSLGLTQPPAGVRPGQSASVSITVARADGALAVPSAAVRTVGGQSTVTVLTGGQEETRAVQVGVRSEALVQVTSGLADGDQVVLTLPTAAAGTGGAGGARQPGGGGGAGGFGGGGTGAGGAVIPGGTGR